MKPGAPSIRDAVAHLAAAYEAAGLPPIRRPKGADAELRRIAAAMAPMRLPVELVEFWRQVDPESVTVAPYPRLTTPAFALDSWQLHRGQNQGEVPMALFPVAYESHGYLMVELEAGHGTGGPVFSWAYTDETIVLQFPSLAAYVDLLATMIELGEFTHHQTDGRSWVEFDPDDRWSDAVAVRLASARPVGIHGDVPEIEAKAAAWPQAWQVASGLAPETRALRGATATIEDVLRRAEGGEPVTATVRARVVQLAGTAEGSRATIDDGTASLDLWCPAAVCAYGPIIRTEFEFDIVVGRSPKPSRDWRGRLRDVQARALGGDLDGAREAAISWHRETFGTPAAAEATAVRPVD